LIEAGEQVIIMGFRFSETPIEAQIVLADANNRIDRRL